MITGAMKSYELLKTRATPAELGTVAQIANELKTRGFEILTARFGKLPCITVKPNHATKQLESVCTGFHNDETGMYATYTAGYSGITIKWHKRLKHNVRMH